MEFEKWVKGIASKIAVLLVHIGDVYKCSNKVMGATVIQQADKMDKNEMKAIYKMYKRVRKLLLSKEAKVTMKLIADFIDTARENITNDNDLQIASKRYIDNIEEF